MKFINPAEFKATRAWDALPIANLDGTTVRLHWTDQPYRWHVNDGQEVFVVLEGAVDMHYREAGETRIRTMQQGEICHAAEGDEHVAHPHGPAYLLVVEREGSA